jgi:hypothetical protein
MSPALRRLSILASFCQLRYGGAGEVLDFRVSVGPGNLARQRFHLL